jgi:hypothetical protein
LASKYAGLRGKIPVQRTPRAEALVEALRERRSKKVGELTTEYNAAKAVSVELAAKTAANKVILDALEILIREYLDANEADGIKSDGYTWTPTYVPYPSADDPAAVIKYFRENNMEDLLQLKNSELAERLKAFVKAEAAEGTLIIEEREVTDPDTGETKMVQDVRSNIPGVKVFMSEGLSRVKSSNKGAK